MSKLSENIKSRRKQLNMTQDELAKKLGYKSRSSINKIELGINDISQRQIVSFAKALDTTPAYLLGIEEEKKDNNIIIYTNGRKKEYQVTNEQLEIIISMLNQFIKE